MNKKKKKKKSWLKKIREKIMRINSIPKTERRKIYTKNLGEVKF